MPNEVDFQGPCSIRKVRSGGMNGSVAIDLGRREEGKEW